MQYNKRVNRLLTLAQKVFLKKMIIENLQLVFKLRTLLADIRTWQIHNKLSNKSKLKNLLINIHTQLNRLIEIQYDILNVMRQRINFSFVLIKQFDSNEFENELEIDVNDEKTFSWLNRFKRIFVENDIID